MKETITLQDVDQIHSGILSALGERESFEEKFPLASSFYFEIKDHVDNELPSSFYFSLYKFLNKQIENTKEDFSKLYPRSLNLYHAMKNLKNEETGTITTDDKREAERLARKGINVDIRTEQEDELENTSEEIPTAGLEKLGETIQSVLLEGLRNIGEEITSSTHSANPPNQVKIQVQFKNKEEETWNFEVRDNTMLVLLDAIPEEVLADVEVLPSGEIKVNRPVLIDAITNYLNKSYISEEEEEEVPEEDPYREPDIHATKNYDDVEAGVTEKISIGHEDNEAGMMKQSAYEILKYAEKLYNLFDQHDSLNTQVDYPHWLQSLVIRSRDYVGKAAHYLEFKQMELDTYQEPQPDDEVQTLRTLSEKAFSLGVISEQERKAIEKACREGHLQLVKEYMKKKIESLKKY